MDSNHWSSILDSVKLLLPTTDSSSSSLENDDIVTVFQRPAGFSLKVLEDPQEDLKDFLIEDAELQLDNDDTVTVFQRPADFSLEVPEDTQEDLKSLLVEDAEVELENDDIVTAFQRPADFSIKVPEDTQEDLKSILIEDAELEGQMKVKADVFESSAVKINSHKGDAFIKPKEKSIKHDVQGPVLSFEGLEQMDFENILQDIKENGLSLKQNTLKEPTDIYAGGIKDRSQENIMDKLVDFCKSQTFKSVSVASSDHIRLNERNKSVEAELQCSSKEHPTKYTDLRRHGRLIKPPQTSYSLSPDYKKALPVGKSNLKVHTGSKSGDREVTGKGMLLRQMREMKENEKKYINRIERKPEELKYKPLQRVESTLIGDSQNLQEVEKALPLKSGKHQMESPLTGHQSVTKKQRARQQQQEDILKELEKNGPITSVRENQAGVYPSIKPMEKSVKYDVQGPVLSFGQTRTSLLEMDSNHCNSILDSVELLLPTTDSDSLPLENDDIITVFQRPADFSFRVPEDTQEDLKRLLIEDAKVEGQMKVKADAFESNTMKMNSHKGDAFIKPKEKSINHDVQGSVLSFTELEQMDFENILQDIKENGLSLKQNALKEPRDTYAGGIKDGSQENIMDELVDFCKSQTFMPASVQTSGHIRLNNERNKSVEAELQCSSKEHPTEYTDLRCHDRLIKPPQTSHSPSPDYKKAPPAEKPNLKVHTGSERGDREVTGKCMLLRQIRQMKEKGKKCINPAEERKPEELKNKSPQNVESTFNCDSQNLQEDEQALPLKSGNNQMESPLTGHQSLTEKQRARQQQQQERILKEPEKNGLITSVRENQAGVDAFIKPMEKSIKYDVQGPVLSFEGLEQLDFENILQDIKENGLSLKQNALKEPRDTYAGGIKDRSQENIMDKVVDSIQQPTEYNDLSCHDRPIKPLQTSPSPSPDYMKAVPAENHNLKVHTGSENENEEKLINPTEERKPEELENKPPQYVESTLNRDSQNLQEDEKALPVKSGKNQMESPLTADQSVTKKQRARQQQQEHILKELEKNGPITSVRENQASVDPFLRPKEKSIQHNVQGPVLSFGELEQMDFENILQDIKENGLSLKQNAVKESRDTYAGGIKNRSQENIMDKVVDSIQQPTEYNDLSCHYRPITPQQTSPSPSSDYKKPPPAENHNLKVHTESENENEEKLINPTVERKAEKLKNKPPQYVESTLSRDSQNLQEDEKALPVKSGKNQMESPLTADQSVTKKQRARQRRHHQHILKKLEKNRPIKSVRENQAAAENTQLLYDSEASHLQSLSPLPADIEGRGHMLLTVLLSSPGVVRDKPHKKRRQVDPTKAHIYNTLVAWFVCLVGPNVHTHKEVPFWVAGLQQVWTEDGLALHVLSVAHHSSTAKKTSSDVHTPFYNRVHRFLSETSLLQIAHWFPQMNMQSYTSPIILPSSFLNSFILATSNKKVIDRTFILSPGFYWQTVETEENICKGRETTQELHTEVSVMLGCSDFFQNPLITHYTLQQILDSGLDVCGLRLLYPPEGFLSDSAVHAPFIQRTAETSQPLLALAVRGPYAHSLLTDVIKSVDCLVLQGTSSTPVKPLTCRSPDLPVLYSPELVGQVHRELCLWFSGRLNGGSGKHHNLSLNRCSGDDGLNDSPLCIKTAPSSLCATMKADLLLVASPLVPPSCYGQVLAVCERRGFILRGLQRLELQTCKDAALGLNKQQVHTFCSPPSVSRGQKTPFHCLVLILRKENALHHSFSLPAALMREFKAQDLLSFLHSAGHVEPSYCFHMVPYSSNLFHIFSRSTWAVPNPSAVILSRQKCPYNTEMEQVVVLTVCRQDMSQGLDLLHRALTQPGGQKGFELLGLKWLPALTRLQAQAVSPYEVGEPLSIRSEDVLMSSPAVVFVLRREDSFTTLRNLLPNDYPSNLGVLMSPTPEVASRQISLFFSEHEMIPYLNL